jgi:SAM-dependent methyltransferase
MSGIEEKRARWDQRYASTELVWSAGPNALLAEELTGEPPGSALDAACGEGRNGLWLAEQGWQVTAVDFSAVAIEKGQEIARRRGLTLNWRVADLARDPLPEDAFDLVVVLYLHTDPAERALWLPRLVRAVAPGGTFFYLGHDPENIEHGLGGPQNPELLPDAATIVAALPGFDVITAGIYRRPVDADPGHGREQSGIALDTYVRAVAPVLSSR